MNPWSKRIAAVLSATIAVILLTSTAASAQSVQPKTNQGWISLVQQTCGTSAGWQQQAIRNGSSAATGWIVIFGKTYDIQCAGSTQPAAPTQTISTGWTNPLPGYCGRTTSFGQPRYDKNGNFDHWHVGTDMGAPDGKKIVAASAGVVTKAGGGFGGGGYGVRIQHANGVITNYYHMPYTWNGHRGWIVAVGQHVAKGQQIGVVGHSGDASGPHLHFETRVNGTFINPTTFMRQHGAPINC